MISDYDSEYEKVKAILNSEYGKSAMDDSKFNELKENYNRLKEPYSDTDSFKTK